MKKNYSKSSLRSPAKATARGAQPQKHQSKGALPPRSAPVNLQKEKLQYPRSWRQVAGTHAILELLQIHPQSMEVVLVEKNWRSSHDLRELVERLEKKRIKIEEKSEAALQEICRSHQGAVAYSSLTLEFEYTKKNWEDKKSLIVALDGVEDTQNLGAILRTSWLMGVDGIIIPEDRAVGLTASVHKVACGGAEHVPICRTNQFSNPFEYLKKAGFWVFGLSHKSTKTIYDLKLPDKIIWVLGAEDKGLRVTTEKACDELVSIPQASAQASYNVSVSAALALAEAKRQWR